MYTAYAWKPGQDTPLMRKQVHRLCVEISQDSHEFVDISGELLQLFRQASVEMSAARPLQAM